MQGRKCGRLRPNKAQQHLSEKRPSPGEEWKEEEETLTDRPDHSAPVLTHRHTSHTLDNCKLFTRASQKPHNWRRQRQEATKTLLDGADARIHR